MQKKDNIKIVCLYTVAKNSNPDIDLGAVSASWWEINILINFRCFQRRIKVSRDSTYSLYNRMHTREQFNVSIVRKYTECINL